MMQVNKSVFRKSHYHFRRLLGLNSQIKKPVFITGSPRSGTTILGTAISYHPDITYLNEPRSLWISCYPEYDIWTENATQRKGRLYLDSTICTSSQNKKLHRLFYRQMFMQGKPRLVEKYPINNFRLNFLDSVFPDALFVHIVRNGLEVARSIDNMCKTHKFDGARDYKWNQIVSYAKEKAKYKNLPEMCQTDYDRGLLEWQLNVETALEFFGCTSSDKFLQVTYEDLVEYPVQTMNGILDFIGVSHNEKVENFVKKNIRRRTKRIPLSYNNISPKIRQITGDLLQQLGYLARR